MLNFQPIDVQNMIKLWGQHERLLNNLVQRYDMVLIKDFYEYFRQPWVYAIFHESFEEKVQTMNQMILRGKTQTDDSILQKIKELLGESNYQKVSHAMLNTAVLVPLSYLNLCNGEDSGRTRVIMVEVINQYPDIRHPGWGYSG